MKLIAQYFPNLTPDQIEKFERMPLLYQEWNAQINVVSRQDIENLEERHILHSLAIAKVFDFVPGAELLDLGTGGGFPGIPLAVLFPEVQFVLIDGTGKKIRVVQEVANALGLSNVNAFQGRAEEIKAGANFDFVLTRGVTTLDKLLVWSQRVLKKKHQHAYPNGVIALKGGNLQQEIKLLPGKGKDYTEVFPIADFFKEPFFEEKSVVYVQG
ncbi:MAG: 16S rRNA (guanine(527)-N(7))-methyltransferase RsmG [Lewinellaceae bacterium]|nr:16S rRNA (guanine(527)-N(7))-methyltransferase RsmG [Lewinellaceae bacterium]